MQRRDPETEAAHWLVRADRDLEAAVELVSAARPLPDIAVFHAQQAAEKALMAFLVVERRQFARTHDLVALLADCVALEPRFTARRSRNQK